MAYSRITDSMMNYGFLSGMNKSLNQQYKLMEQTSDGKLIHRPSDDPVRVIRSLQYRSAIVQNEQFKTNVKDATSWMEMTDKAVSDLSEVMSAAKALVVRAIAPNPDIAYKAAATQLDGLINEAVQIANTKIGDRYIFSGQMDSTQPFERLTLADPSGQSNLNADAVVYYGDDKKISIITQAGVINTARDSVNLTGVDVFGRSSSLVTQYGQATTDVFSQLIRIKEELERTAIATPTNSLGGTLDVDGGYTGSSTYQDFAVKIDALKVRLNSYTQSNTTGGSLSLSYTGDKANMPAYTTPNSLRMRIDALKVTPTVTAPVGHATGALTMESTVNPPPAAPLFFRVDAVQVETGAVSQSNALAGALNVEYNGYKGTPPANLMVRTTATTPAYGVTKSDATSGNLAVTAITGSAGLASKVRIDSVNGANQIVTASYYDTVSNSWQAATVTTASPSVLALGTTGMTATIATAAGNTAGDEYALETSKRVSGIQYSVDGGTTWLAPASAATYLTQSNSAGGTAVVADPDQATRLDQTFKVRVDGVGAGLVTAASVSTDGGTTWNTAAVAGGVVTLPSGITMTIGASANTAVNDTYQYKVPPVFTLDNAGNDIGMKVSVASTPENGVGASNTYTVPLTNTGKVMQASYSAVVGGPYVAATPNNAVNPFSFSLGGAFAGLSVNLGTVATNVVGDIHQVTAMSTAGEVTQASFSTDGGATWSAAKADTAAPAGSFTLGNSGFKAHIASNSTNTGTNTYTLSDLSMDANAEPAAMSYSLDHGNTWIKATAPVVTKSTANSGDLTIGGKYTGLPAYQDLVVTAQAWKVNATITPPAGGGAMKMAYAGAAIPAAVTALPPRLRVDTVDSSGKVTALSYSDDGITWKSATANASQGPTVFSLGDMGAPATDYTGFSVAIADKATNAAGGIYTTAVAAANLQVGDPALVSYTTEPAPDSSGTLTPSTSAWSMKDANPSVSGFALPDGVTADIETNTSTVLGTSTYSFRIPPRFTLQDGVQVSVDPNANNNVKDAYTFHMPPATLHTADDLTAGPDLDWLSDKGLADLDSVHDQILSALTEIGTQASSYEMKGNMLETMNTNLTAVLATNEDVDMAKAIIDMKTAENTYKAALSFGSRVMPTSLVDFLR